MTSKELSVFIGVVKHILESWFNDNEATRLIEIVNLDGFGNSYVKCLSVRFTLQAFDSM